MVCGKCKLNNTNAVCYCNSCFQNARIKSKQEGRVEGAIAELRFQLKELNSWKGYKIAFEDGVQNIEKTNFFNQIKNNLKKRLKELEKGGKE